MAHIVIEEGYTILRDDWCIDDVRARLEDYWGFELTDEECAKVLTLVADAFDANIGVNWDAIDAAIQTLYADGTRIEEDEE